MAIIAVHGREIDVDIEKEISKYSWSRPKWRTDRLIACSPFRYDSSPSFYVYFEDTSSAFAGSWGDSGGGQFQKGHLIQLLAYLEDCSEEEIVDYLIEEYASDWDGESKLTLDLSRLKMKTKERGLDMKLLDSLAITSDYLLSRGISFETQRYYNNGYDEENNIVTFPYVTPNGRLAALKKRKTDSKLFFYAGGGIPMRELVFGIDLAHRDGHTRAIATEAEIDAEYAYEVTGILGIGVGTSSLSDEKTSVIMRSPITDLIIAADNDAAGEKLAIQFRKKLGGLVRLYTIDFPEGCKDLNDMTPQQLTEAIENKKAVETSLFNVA